MAFDACSERKWKKVFLAVSIPVMLCVLLYLIGIDWGFWEVTPIWLLMLAGMVFMHSKGIGWILDHYTWGFEWDGIVKRRWGRTKKYSYQELIQELRGKKVKITPFAYVVPMKDGAIKFYYDLDTTRQRHLLNSYRYLKKQIEDEIPVKITPFAYVVPMKDGAIKFYYDLDTTRQRHLLNSYRYLKKQIEDEIPNLPDMSKIIIGEMDQREYYRKKRRNYGIAALGVSLFIPLILDSASVVMGIFVIIIQYISLWIIFKAIYFGKKAEIKIEKRFARDTEIELYIRKVSYLYLIVIAVLMVGLNIFWIWF